VLVPRSAKSPELAKCGLDFTMRVITLVNRRVGIKNGTWHLAPNTSALEASSYQGLASFSGLNLFIRICSMVGPMASYHLLSAL